MTRLRELLARAFLRKRGYSTVDPYAVPFGEITTTTTTTVDNAPVVTWTLDPPKVKRKRRA